MKQFIGRQKELAALKQLKQKNSASLVVITGRRRIGKSRLAQELARSFKRVCLFTGLPPAKGITAKMQREEFIRQMQSQQISSNGHQDWGDLFEDVAKYAASGEVLVVLDEITWMGSLDPAFLGKLKIAWDEVFKKNTRLILLLSGSNSAWIEANILSSTGFFGRTSYRLDLSELPLHDCNAFWGKLGDQISAYEKFKVLAVTGGIPRYLEEIQPKLTAEDNIYRLCYQAQGLLFYEFDHIFSDLFQKRTQTYQQVLIQIASGANTVEQIAQALNREKGGDLSQILADLVQDGFIRNDQSWHLNTGKPAKTKRYRISDNYLSFYLKYILPHHARIAMDEMYALPIGWESIMGLQFENLVINNRKILHRLLNIPPHEIIHCNPYLQTQTKTRSKCQIDYLIQTKFNVLYVCEIKFSRSPLSMRVVEQVQSCIQKLVVSKGVSIRPVLIQVNGVQDALIAADYFAQIIDFSEFLKGCLTG